jgi:hypothetical protein
MEARRLRILGFVLGLQTRLLREPLTLLVKIGSS